MWNVVAVILRAKDAMLLLEPPAKVIATYVTPSNMGFLITTPAKKADAVPDIEVIWAAIEPFPFKI